MRRSGRRALVLILKLLLLAQWQVGDVTGRLRPSQELYGRLVHNYNRQLRPVRRPDVPVPVHLGASLVEVLGLDEVRSHITVKIWLTLQWHDDYLMWEPQQFSGIERLNMEAGTTDTRIWTPDIKLLNTLKTDDSIVTDAVVRYDGSVTWIRPIVYTVTSRHEFRGNSWSVKLKFASWTYDAALLDLQPLPGSSVGRRLGRSEIDNEIDSEPVRMDTSSFEPSDLWGLLENRGRLEVTEFPCCPNEPYTSIAFTIKLRKKIGPSLLGRRGRR